ncbi:BRO-N domain-containing protein [Brenneria uluponensis]|uniref:BRO-N domain-containing protein n=1 Tax=Brenneria uluponensis TaxID=3057057 RepID=UPI0028F07919|nr:BRO family protein [Brenneria ulupoensis]
MTTSLSFNDHQFNVVTRNNQLWLTAADITRALGYQTSDSVSRIYARNSNEFSPQMTLIVKLTVKGFGNGNSEKDVRIFSLRGAHLIAMFARTPVAKEFRRWVLDVLDREVEKAHQLTSDQSANHSPSVNFPVSNTDNEYRYLVQMFIYDTVFGGCVEMKGKGNTFKSIANGIASDLGYRPTGFVEGAVNRDKLVRV